MQARSSKNAFNKAVMAGLVLATMAGAVEATMQISDIVSEMTTQTQSCTILQSDIHVEGQGRRGPGYEVNYIQTKECGTLRNSSVSLDGSYLDTFCRLVPGDTVALKTFFNPLSDVRGLGYRSVKEIGAIQKHDSSLVTSQTPGPQHFKNTCATQFHDRESQGFSISVSPLNSFR